MLDMMVVVVVVVVWLMSCPMSILAWHSQGGSLQPSDKGARLSAQPGGRKPSSSQAQPAHAVGWSGFDWTGTREMSEMTGGRTNAKNGYDGLAVGGRKAGVIFSALNGLNVTAHHETRVFVGQPQLLFCLDFAIEETRDRNSVLSQQGISAIISEISPNEIVEIPGKIDYWRRTGFVTTTERGL
ncbi:hypothetical protein B0T13DRAFT_449417 [Neurospora crassa]|nr:hypothetical protein B0T13DRAFT_449417 [Neurospora crassa]